MLQNQVFDIYYLYYNISFVPSFALSQHFKRVFAMSFELETFEDRQPSQLRRRFAFCRVGNFTAREIDLRRVNGQEIVRIDERPWYSPRLEIVEVRAISETEMYALYTLINGNDPFLDKVEALLRESMEDVTAEEYDKMPMEKLRMHFYNTPFSLHTLGENGGIDFSKAATLRLVMPDVLDPHLEEIERSAPFWSTLFKVTITSEADEKMLLAQEVRSGSESGTQFHTLLKLEGNELGI